MAEGRFSSFGSQCLKSIINRVCSFLKPFEVYALSRTCKRFFELCPSTTTPFTVAELVNDSNAKMVDFLARDRIMEMHADIRNDMDRHDTTLPAPLINVKWQIQMADVLCTHYLVSGRELIMWLLCYKMVEAARHLLKSGKIQQKVDFVYFPSVEMLDLFYEFKKVSAFSTGDPWEDVILETIDEDWKMEWVFKHANDPDFSFDNLLNDDIISKNHIRFLAHGTIFHSPFVIQHYYNFFLYEFEETMPIDVCAQIEEHTRRHIPSSWCECANPDRHENLKVIKRRKLR